MDTLAIPDPANLIPMGKAAQRFGISRSRLTRLAQEGRFSVYQNAYDYRKRLVDINEVAKALEIRLISGPEATQ